MITYYNRAGEPLADVFAWAALFEDEVYKRVVESVLADGTWISTVWLGLDHNHTGKGPPLIFETMVFPSKESRDGRERRRYPTEAAARAGHMEIVARLPGG